MELKTYGNKPTISRAVVKAETFTDDPMPTPLTHEERLAVINAPWPTVNVVTPKSWAGTIIRHGIGADMMPEDGRRVFSPSAEDEQWFLHIAGE